MKPLVKFVLTAAVILLLLLSAILIIVVGSSFIVAATGSSVHYSIETSGLATVSVGEPVVLYFPLPFIHQTSVLSDERYTQIFDGWTARTVETPRGLMLEFTATKYPLKDIYAEFGEGGINYLEMLLSGRVPKEFGSLSLLPSSSFSSDEVFVYGRTLYESTDTATMAVIPQFLENDSIEIHLHVQLSTSPNISGLFLDRWMIDHLYAHAHLENISGLATIPIVSIKEHLPPDGEPLPIDPPKGVYDSVLSIEGTAVPGHTAHYEYVVGNATSELRFALVWDDPEYPLTMTLISPRGYILGPYTDRYDYREDGNIPLSIKADYFLSGEWGIDISVKDSAPSLKFQPYQIHVREY